MNLDHWDKAALCRFLATWNSAYADPNTLIIERLTGGASNLTFRLSSGNEQCVLRCPPPGVKAATAHDMVREARVLQAVRPHFPYCPQVHAVCEDETILGAPFFVMALIEGVIPGREMPVPLTPKQAGALCEAMIACQVELHGVDLKASGLEKLGKPEGYVARQISGWSKRFRNARTEDVADGERVMAWLDSNQPEEVGAALIHNDFKLDNLVLDPSDPTRINAVLDWEMATVGDPLMDLGASLAYWVQRDDPVPLQMMRILPSQLKGMLTRDQLVARYAELSGRTIDDYRYYYVYGLFRLAGIAQQIYYRYTLGQTREKRFAMFGQGVNALLQQAERIINQIEQERSFEARMDKITSNELFRLDGKVALVTGASRGIGEAVAHLFAKHGAKVIVSSRKQEACEAVVAAIRDQGGEAEAMACHIGDASQRAALIERIEAEFGRLDILVNNAATNPYFGHILDTPDSAVAKTVDVNINGFFHLSQLAGRVMRRQGGGCIINTASINGVKPGPMQGIYSITKAAIISMTKAFASECAAQNIRVNAVLPGLTETKFASALTQNPAMLKMILPQIPQGRVAEPAEIAPAFLYLASDAAAYVTGVDLPVDGGLLI